jgi:ribosomal protein S18 acetylase RimI-like enzyme
MQPATIRPVDELDRREFVQAVNAAYSDYFVPITLSARSFDDLAARESVDLSASGAALVDGKIVGMGLLGVREGHAWIGGMGVVPAYRRLGIARQIMQHLIVQAARCGARSVQLEVIVENAHAHHLYRTCGFEDVRQLYVLACGPRRGLPVQPPTDGLTFDAERAAPLVKHLDNFQADRRPWQREPVVFDLIGRQVEALAARAGKALRGVCLHIGDGYHRGLLDCKAATPDAGRALIGELLARYPDAHFTYLNIAEDDPLLPLFREAGFAISVSQIEMFLYLDREPSA